MLDRPRTFVARVFLTNDQSSLRAGWRMLAHFLLLVFMLIIVQIGVRTLWHKSLNETVNEVRRILPVGLTFIFSIYLARRYLDKKSFKSLGLLFDHYTVTDLLFGFMISAVETGSMFLVFRELGWVNLAEWNAPSFASWFIAGIWLVGIWWVIGFYEELLFRGYWLENLSDGLGPYWAWFGTAVLFGLAHFSNSDSSWLSTLNLFLTGLSLGYAKRRAKNLWLSIGMHTSWNFFLGTVFGFSVSGTDTFRLMQTTLTGPKLFTGGAFGPEAGILMILFVAFELGAIYLWTRNR